jgi:hypothetical protein
VDSNAKAEPKAPALAPAMPKAKPRREPATLLVRTRNMEWATVPKPFHKARDAFLSCCVCCACGLLGLAVRCLRWLT